MTAQHIDQQTETTEVKRRMQEPIRPKLPPVKTFHVRRFAPTQENLNSVPAAHWEEGIEAHRYEEHVNGSVSFYRYLEADISDKGLFYTYTLEKLLGPGTWYDIREVTKDFQTQSAN